MTNLEQALADCHMVELPFVQDNPALWQALCGQNSTLFDNACRNKPDTLPTHHLLGLLTKAHIESSTKLGDSDQARDAMTQVFQETLGEAHANKFVDQTQKEFMLVTHCWLYLQGYLNMDFGLANDHAENSATLLGQLKTNDNHQLRTEFVKSYYLGKQHSPSKETQTWLSKLLKVFK